MKKITIENIRRKKNKGKITMLTCYDYSFAKALDAVGLDIILVGDSLANVVLGLDETKKVSLREMLNHTKAVSKGVKHACLVADMPYVSYQKNPEKSLYHAKNFIEAGADAVKIEWFKDCVYVVKRLLKHKIPVMGHIGLTPQTVHLLGGYKVQGKDEESAKILFKQAKALESLGIFSLVLECIPYQISRIITSKVKIPTIGIGAGSFCDGQVLVLYDLLGLNKGKGLKFARKYTDLYAEIERAASKFIKDVKKSRFPLKKESFSLEKGKKVLF